VLPSEGTFFRKVDVFKTTKYEPSSDMLGGSKKHVLTGAVAYSA
jgi:hypothetical protein